MSQTLRLLLVEDSERDATLLLREIRRANYEPISMRVETASGMRAALGGGDKWDAVIADYTLPQFDAVSALKVLKDSRLDLPFIIVSGSIGEEIAVAAMKAGAHDYLMKGKLARLVPAIEREIKESHNRQERRQAQEDREQLLRRERTAREEAERANRLKDEFLATISHELRTPANIIMGWSEMLCQGEIGTGELHDVYEILLRNAKTQARLIGDVLDVSRIITGKLTLKLSPIKLGKVIEDAVEAVRAGAEAKGVSLVYRPCAINAVVEGDADRLQQIAWNILANAIKFTSRQGQVEVRVEKVNGCVEFIVSDSGEGIAPDFLPFVFDRFLQENGAITRRHGGLGLGLAIVRHIAEMHGGNVEAKSAGKGKGSVFTVRLPVAHSGNVPFNGGPLPRREPSLITGKKVLVVDDSEDTLMLVRVLLEKVGAQVTTCLSAATAYDFLQTARIDALLCDIGMPEEDGYSFMRRVRTREAETGAPRLPSAALTAYVNPEDRESALRAGFDRHVAKPIEIGALIAAISAILSRHEAKER